MLALRCRSLAVIVALGLAAGCAKVVHDPIAREVDFADPKSVLGGVIYAARSGDPAVLATLCDPGGASEPSVTRICHLATGDAAWGSFVRTFRDARINGEPRVHGDHAAVNFVYGEGGVDSETMELTRRAGRWYLLRF